jgi:hypothetical protein
LRFLLIRLGEVPADSGTARMLWLTRQSCRAATACAAMAQAKGLTTAACHE